MQEHFLGMAAELTISAHAVLCMAVVFCTSTEWPCQHQDALAVFRNSSHFSGWWCRCQLRLSKANFMSAPVRLSIVLPYAVFEPHFISWNPIPPLPCFLLVSSLCMILYDPAHPGDLSDIAWQNHKVSPCHLLQILPPHSHWRGSSILAGW